MAKRDDLSHMSQRQASSLGQSGRHGVVASKHKSAHDRPSNALPILLVCLVVVLSCSCIGVAYLGMQEQDEAPAPAIQIQEEASPDQDAREMSATPVPAHADDVVMTLNGDRDTIVLVGEEYLEAGCHAVQDGVGIVTDAVQVRGDVDTSVPGDYTVTYRLETADGRYADATRTVHVVQELDKAADLPVLMYHWVYTAMDPPESLDGNYILDTDLEQQLSYLKDQDFYYPSFEEVRAFVDGTHTLPAKSVVVTFDDGEQGFLDHGIPLLEQYEVPATSFYICRDDDSDDGSPMRTLAYASPFVRFQSHSYDLHKAGSSGIGRGGAIYDLSADELYEDALAAERILGDVEAMAYPFGDNCEAAWEALERAGVLCAFTVQNDRVTPGENPYALDRVRISGEYTLSGFKELVA